MKQNLEYNPLRNVASYAAKTLLVLSVTALSLTACKRDHYNYLNLGEQGKQRLDSLKRRAYEVGLDSSDVEPLWRGGLGSKLEEKIWQATDDNLDIRNDSVGVPIYTLPQSPVDSLYNP